MRLQDYINKLMRANLCVTPPVVDLLEGQPHSAPICGLGAHGVACNGGLLGYRATDASSTNAPQDLPIRNLDVPAQSHWHAYTNIRAYN